jgi:hypothetical protein
MSGTFRWWPVNGGRHGIPGELAPGENGTTLCGIAFNYTGHTPAKLEWLWPTCKVCNQKAYSLTHVLLAGYRK